MSETTTRELYTFLGAVTAVGAMYLFYAVARFVFVCLGAWKAVRDRFNEHGG